MGLQLNRSRARSVTNLTFAMSQVHRTTCKAMKAIRRQAIIISWDRRKEGREKFPHPPHRRAPQFKLPLRWLGAIGLATALALAGVLALASVLFLGLLVVLFVLPLVLALLLATEGSLQRRKQSRSLDCRTGAGEQSRKRRTSEQCLCCLGHAKNLLSIRMRCKTPCGRSSRLVDRDSRSPV